MSEDLWGDIERVQTIRTPKSIISEQGKILEKKTSGLLRGFIRRYDSERDTLYFAFEILAPTLNYSFELFRFKHRLVPPFPVELELGVPGRGAHKCEDEDSLKKTLHGIFTSEETKRVISSLLSHVDAES